MNRKFRISTKIPTLWKHSRPKSSEVSEAGWPVKGNDLSDIDKRHPFTPVHMLLNNETQEAHHLYVALLQTDICAGYDFEK